MAKKSLSESATEVAERPAKQGLQIGAKMDEKIVSEVLARAPKDWDRLLAGYEQAGIDATYELARRGITPCFRTPRSLNCCASSRRSISKVMRSGRFMSTSSARSP